MPEKLRLSLTAPALEQLIGGNTEIELEIRQCVASAFARRHLGNLLNEETQRTIAAARDGVKQEIADSFSRALLEIVATLNVDSYGRVRATLKPEVIQQIESHVRGAAGAIMNETITTAIEQRLANINAEISRIVKEHLAQHLKAEVVARLKSAINEAFPGA